MTLMRAADVLLAVAATVFVVGLVMVPVLLLALGIGLLVGWSWLWEPNPDLLRITAGAVLVWTGVLAAGLLLRELAEYNA